MKIIFWLVFASALIYSSFFTEKDRLDREVKRLCAIDGGIKVYETVKLSADRFEKDGSIYIPSKQIAKLDDDYYYESFQQFLVEGNPSMWRNQYRVYRMSDNKLIGEASSYSRHGGNIPGPWHGSSFRCPVTADITNLNMQIFIKE
ncbi:MAG: hypothetical protein LZF85_07165 [Nitrosomonas sp.]|uniref:hypothetical protein n=1 Tax=Nitrosomonas sp. TaxID=42353 RepID=UPI0025CD07DF|nr:hypothetical protein [Nitrosomonas sp.]UJP04202.1 MAG: hypothetical protein LZF85_07165 [Nitrosomonas sp.]